MECLHICYRKKTYKNNYIQCKDHLFQSWLPVLDANEIEIILCFFLNEPAQDGAHCIDKEGRYTSR